MNATCVGGPFDGRVIDAKGKEILFPIHVPAKRSPTDDDGMIFDAFGFVRWADPDCNPTYPKHVYTWAKDEHGRYLAYEGIRT